MKQNHLLVIEDDPAVRELLVGCLTNQNHRVSAVATGEEGLRLIEEDRPHLVVLDLALPGMSGLDVCRAIRRDPWMEKLPVLMLTGSDADDDVVAGLDVGADDYMTKPFALKVLTARVAALLRRDRGEGLRQEQSTKTQGSVLEIRTLGRCELQLGQQTVSWTEAFSASQRALLAALLAVPNGQLSQEEVQLSFWPDSTPAKARSNFDSLMTRTRRTLEQELLGIDVRRHLQVRRGIVSLEHVRVDAHEFRRLIGRALQETQRGALWPAELAFSAAFSLWHGAFLPGSFGSDHASRYQDEIELVYLEGGEAFARILANGGRYGEAIKLLRDLLRCSPTHDGAIRLLYLLLLEQNHPVQAAQLLDQYAALLSRDKFSASEVAKVIREVPKQLPAGGWLRA